MILGATNSIEEKEFYIKMCIKNNYSKREIEKYNKTIIATHMKDETREALKSYKLHNILVKEDGYKIKIEDI